MCGIVGYIGRRAALPIVLEGLRRLEYRGYDSAGVAVHAGNMIQLKKAAGRLSVLESRITEADWPGTVGMGHTRWASHGRPSDANSHPHVDCHGKFYVVHNGIIENYRELRRWLEQRGHIFYSETDTEVVPHLMEEYDQSDVEGAFLSAIEHLQGAFALVAMSSEEPDKLLAYRKDSPLVVGLGKGESFLASDIPALLPYTRETYLLEDGEMVILTAEGVVVKQDGRTKSKEIFHVDWDPITAEKAGYEHFMLKEIFEQPQAIRDTLAGRLSKATDGLVTLPELELSHGDVVSIQKLYIVACGTSFNAGLVGKQAIERLAKLRVEVDIASEFRYREPLLGEGTAVLVISQSGETADTLAALREAKRQGVPVWAITNVVGSSVAREADVVLATWAGPEIAVASTKAYTTQLTMLILLAIKLAELRQAVDRELLESVTQGLALAPDLVHDVLQQDMPVRELAEEIATHKDVFFIGRGLDYAAVLEAALKLKEISYIHAEAMAAGELKHGTLALITDGTPVICLLTQPHLKEKMESNIAEVEARGANVLLVDALGGDSRVNANDGGRKLTLPPVHPLLAPILTIVPLQLLAYHVARELGCDVDKPRNLAKSVTIE